MKTLLKASLIASAIAAIPSSALALGAGPINVFSGLGQPLRAEVPLYATPQELQSLSARIASPDAFRQANLPYSPALSQVRVSVERSGNQPVLRITSDRPVNEPFLNVLLELSWDAGRLVREYTFLLDPVSLPPTRTPQVAPVAAPTPARIAPAAAAGTVASGSYRVQRGDTLRRIAEANRPAEVTLEQMLIALARQNPAAFDSGNINRLKAGAVLQIPSAEQARAIDHAEARREVMAQVADFDAYRRRLAAAAPAATSADSSGQASEGKITPRVEDAARPDTGADRVQVSRSTDQAGSGDVGTADRLRVLEEDLAARDRALDEANQRLADLERSIRDLQKLIELKNEQLALLQQQAGLKAPSATNAQMPAQDAASATSDQAAPATPAQVPAVEPQASAVESKPEPQAAQQAGLEAAPKAEDAASKPEEAASKPQAAPPAARKPAPPPEPQPQPSFLEELLGDPLILGAGGGALALLLGYAGFKLRQRRKHNEQAEPSALMSQLPTGPNSVFGTTGGQSVDTTSSSVLQTDFSQSGLSSIDTDEGVDPVAEADVYMAYGRDAQAEEILVDALKADPARLAIYLKLLELYAARKSTKQFETIAAELYARSGGEGAEWDKAAALGREIDPDNPLYAQMRQDPATPEVASDRKTGSQSDRSETLTAAAAGAFGAAAVAADDMGSETPAGAQEDAAQPATVEQAEEELPQSLGALEFELPDIEPGQTAVEQAAAPATGQTGETQLKDTWTMPGGQLAFTDTDTGAEPATPEASLPEIDPNVLDFNLDFETPGAAEPQSGAEPAEQSSEADLITGGAEPSSGENAATDSAFIDLDLPAAEAVDFDLDAPQAPAGRAGEAGADMAATVIAGADSYGSETQVEGMEAYSAPSGDVVDLEASSFDTNLLDFDFELDAPPAGATGEPPALDLSNIDLELEAPQPEQSGAGVAPKTAADAAVSSIDDGAGGQEVDTKLELARAYEEMGDKEGARELLEEVLREGNDSQQTAARELLARLD
ncbi:FimV/HubP family polar landmark protein [Pseudothauera hydrothermalis]|uniref:FimV/HubP family polar landmark protein n=1 Tax=Pseudothauera hydrothermalis TaxID=2184083 RepID=UPI000E094108|nr:FimV/HubP family polar landmark protein [Pseudothauera hydrothermalis]